VSKHVIERRRLATNKEGTLAGEQKPADSDVRGATPAADPDRLPSRSRSAAQRSRSAAQWWFCVWGRV